MQRILTAVVAVVLVNTVIYALRHPKQAEESAKTIFVGTPVHAESPVTVNLPNGQKFIGFMPKEMVGSGTVLRSSSLYLTEDRPQGEVPRNLTLWGPGYSPYSWEVLFHIQEH